MSKTLMVVDLVVKGVEVSTFVALVIKAIQRKGLLVVDGPVASYSL